MQDYKRGHRFDNSNSPFPAARGTAHLQDSQLAA